MNLISTAPKDMSLLRRTAEGYAHNMEERKHRLGNEDRRFEREKKPMIYRRASEMLGNYGGG